MLALALLGSCARDPRQQAAARFQKDIQPILRQYCYDCHGDGLNKGQVAFDEFKSFSEVLGRRDLWLAVLKNTRAGIMPPEKKPRPSAEEQRRLEDWIKFDVFGIDPQDPDPGRVTLRRLNRIEYRNTIRDLTGFDYKVEEELPPDDTGYGFDNIGDVLSMSPMLLEKYMEAAEKIVTAVPRAAKVVREVTVPGKQFQTADGSAARDRHSFYDTARLTHAFGLEHAGSYRFTVEVEVLGQFDFDPGRCRLVFLLDDHKLGEVELGWQDRKPFRFEFEAPCGQGDRRFVLELQPLTPVERKKNSLNLRLATLKIQGPLEEEHRVRPKNFERFFTRDVPADPAERRHYAHEVLGRFAAKAFRRPVDEASVDRLVSIAESAWLEPGKSFEDGIAQAMIAVLASPRFLFRVEEPVGGNARLGGRKHPWIDEYALASRLSYFLWSSMPDAELFGLAERGELRRNLSAQVQRMLADPRSQQLIENFVGQWLQVRDVEGIDINAREVLARDRGEEREVEQRRRRFQELNAIPEAQRTPEQRQELQRLAEQRRRRLASQAEIELDGELRRALRQETELCFAHVAREDRSVLELIDSDYTFLNERLARHYGIPNVTGPEMRRVTLPENHPRGGVLTHGAVLIVTSNPTRTSPVKRGLFVLDNLLGTPPPPPPANIPALEDAEKEFQDRQPTLRETLAAHRDKPLCASCHNRMDPLGLALENFNALGMWRDAERGQPIDAAGRLITGETFQNVRELKRTLASRHRLSFYRCLTEKLLTYALGRGLEYGDVHTVDQIVERLDKENGRFSSLLMGVVESAPFQKRRNMALATTDSPKHTISRSAQAKLDL